ncbi:hypothetical protein ACOSQ2_015753 [Xanthoceras sorbifolium]
MATQEKKKKGFMSFYKYSTNKTQKPKSNPVVVATSKAVVSHSLQLKKVENCQEINQNSLLKKLEHRQEMEGDGGRRGVERGGGGGGNILVEGRKSVSHVESNLGSVIAFLQVKVLVSDMPGFMQVHAFRCARRTYDSLEKFSSKHIAYNMKKEFDKVYGPAWHCIVGSSFGSFVTHATGCFLYFSMEKLYILVFKTKVQKALDSIH